jgi:hypothetical protein
MNLDFEGSRDHSRASFLLRDLPSRSIQDHQNQTRHQQMAIMEGAAE